MAGGFHNLGKDSFDITELASLNDDISDEMIEQLEQQLTEKLGLDKNNTNANTNANTNTNTSTVPVNENDDATLFEEVQKPEEAQEKSDDSNTADAPPATQGEAASDKNTEKSNANAPAEAETKTPVASKNEKKEINTTFDDNFIKKYKAKLKSRAQGGGDKEQGQSYGGVAPSEDEPLDNDMMDRSKGGKKDQEEGDIAALSKGKITERALSGDLKSYNDSLDFLDKNVKYSKYVIYIDPQNVNFIENLTVKERKNIINAILRQQDDITITKLRFKVLQTIIRHAIITVLTVAISIPVVYYVINASLEATINNHRSAQTNWQTLYKEHGKITKN